MKYDFFGLFDIFIYLVCIPLFFSRKLFVSRRTASICEVLIDIYIFLISLSLLLIADQFFSAFMLSHSTKSFANSLPAFYDLNNFSKKNT